jgi:hypothetical protein
MAAKAYDNPACHTVDEFMEDMRRIKYIKKSFSRYETTGEIKERLFLNHVIILLNVFGPQFLPRILFFKMREHLRYLKPFLILLSVLPPRVYNIGKDSYTFVTDDIDMDMGIVQRLREL